MNLDPSVGESGRLADAASPSGLGAPAVRHRLIALLLVFGSTLAGCERQPDATKVPGRWYTTAEVGEGARLFAEHCAACHGAKAEGSGGDWRQTLPDGSYPPPPLNGSAHAWHHTLSVLRRSVAYGGIPLGGKMPPFGDNLSAEQIDAVIAYFQSQWDDKIYSAWERRGGVDVER